MGRSYENKNIFIRQSSGLVREISPWASFFATFGLVTGGVPMLILSWLYLSPGANWILSFLITLLPTLGMGFLFYLASIFSPRSGGDYVFLSRNSNPILGFVNYWGIFIAFALSLGLYSYLGAQWFAYLFSGIGLYLNNSSLINLGSFFTTTTGSVIVGLVVLGIITLVSLTGRHGWKFIFIAGIVSIISTIVTFIALSMLNPSEFSSSLSSFTGISNAYNEVINTATSNGLSFFSPFYGALYAIPIVWYYYVWYNLPASWSGEMKKVKLNVLMSIIVAILVIGIYYILFVDLNFHAFGENFLTSWSYIYSNGITNSTVFNDLSGIGTFSPFFTLLVLHNIPIYIIMWIAFWLPNVYSLAPLEIGLTRYLFAWSFDRILPEKVADINDRFHIPIKATLITFILGVIGVLLYGYVTAISIVDITVIFEIGYAIFAFAIALSALLKNTLKKWISIVGFAVFAFLIYALYITWGNPVLLPINLPTILSLILIYGSGFAIYYVSYIMNKRKGIPMELVFKEIPPE
ncbi:amino acid permease [Acidianus sulfidivorans JP7]|uniref:APC family permease n=1 Tax=Acidianus sulfidivorans TaxID=312539 RepID=UPI0014432DF9|nr:APC family permease [Acidianus sulfidivorans]AWR96834.2 amino acid permease [Acidianus sulfidivorans JP7]